MLNNIQNSTNKKIRPKMQCSSYLCENIEPEVGAFKVCAKCKLKYYCSPECQKQHWFDGHKKECRIYKKNLANQ
jgi:hypothetical protein